MIAVVATLRLFAAAREAAGTGRATVEGATVGDVLAEARARYGEGFVAVLAHCRVWRNGEPTSDEEPVGPDDEVAVLPPVSGGG
jgi:molybdopterin synthase sulfur carrier subunit